MFYTRLTGPVVHLHVEDSSKELFRQQSYALKNQLGYPNPDGGIFPSRGLWMRGAGSLWHNIAGLSNTLKLSTNESRASLDLDQ